jgi:hypothetical protein
MAPPTPASTQQNNHGGNHGDTMVAPTEITKENEEVALKFPIWDVRAVERRTMNKRGVGKLILGSYDELTRADIQNLLELIDGAMEEGLTKFEFLAGVFSDHWNTAVPLGPAPTIAKRKANDQQAHVGYWKEDCEQPKRATKGVVKDIPLQRQKGAPAFVKLTPSRLGLSFNAVDQSTQFASLNNVEFLPGNTIPDILAGLIQRYDEREKKEHRDFNIAILTHLARQHLRNWYKGAEKITFVPWYDVYFAEAKYERSAPRAVGLMMFSIMACWAKRVGAVLPISDGKGGEEHPKPLGVDKRAHEGDSWFQGGYLRVSFPYIFRISFIFSLLSYHAL